MASPRSPRRRAQPRPERPPSTERKGNRNVLRTAARQAELASVDWAAEQIERITVDELRRDLTADVEARVEQIRRASLYPTFPVAFNIVIPPLRKLRQLQPRRKIHFAHIFARGLLQRLQSPIGNTPRVGLRLQLAE